LYILLLLLRGIICGWSELHPWPCRVSFIHIKKKTRRRGSKGSPRWVRRLSMMMLLLFRILIHLYLWNI
jgi:hypothetical protein